MQWSIVIPVKGSIGKSRLDAGDARAALAVAFARDAIAAARATPSIDRVVVVTCDGDVTRGLDGIEVVDDPAAGLRAAINAGIATLPAGAPTAVMLGDLPALTPEALESALQLAEREQRSYVPDAIATGTTLLAARRADALRPHFGPGSAQLHRLAGHVELPVAPDSGLRVDVDELADLHIAIDLGVGEHTQAVLRGAQLAA
ncbi:2-phospho-L-lactate guanylyltransferase [Agrococcus sp. ARC_14]|uniref:2-phospho-L-lactate guanylyltransferase n=1 Tax=Agrococcus sp. ARC_14 TaxID=2919927 RepID=UPI001F070D55|nr:2-phospho-L-lactate guanylyltransferase [Agrococcus sp. ARC_14]MCH1883764.1 2-phospho-L-lactate guanylyltransferase [Agrococcus sp. ARC_14]